MITKRKMIVPIFGYKLTIVIFDDWEELKDYLPKEDLEVEAKAITLSAYGASLVAINSKRGSSIVHEAEHIKNHIWSFIGYRPQRDNDEVDADDKEKLFKMIMSEDGGQIDDNKAKHLVSKMYHTSGGRKYVGEKYDMDKAKEVYERFRGIIPASATPADVYVALNAQYHDYCDLFKAWFGDNIDSKIVESAVNFWFKDNDYKGSNKVHDYFKEA